MHVYKCPHLVHTEDASLNSQQGRTISDRSDKNGSKCSVHYRRFIINDVNTAWFLAITMCVISDNGLRLLCVELYVEGFSVYDY